MPSSESRRSGAENLEPRDGSQESESRSENQEFRAAAGISLDIELNLRQFTHTDCSRMRDGDVAKHLEVPPTPTLIPAFCGLVWDTPPYRWIHPISFLHTIQITVSSTPHPHDTGQYLHSALGSPSRQKPEHFQPRLGKSFSMHPLTPQHTSRACTFQMRSKNPDLPSEISLPRALQRSNWHSGLNPDTPSRYKYSHMHVCTQHMCPPQENILHRKLAVVSFQNGGFLGTATNIISSEFWCCLDVQLRGRRRKDPITECRQVD